MSHTCTLLVLVLHGELGIAKPFRYSSHPVKQSWQRKLFTASVHPLQIIELERKAAEQGQAVRGAHVSSWANADVAPEDMYFLDSRGDRNNLVYNGLYRADIAAYYRTDPSGLARGATQHHGRHNQRYICCMFFCQKYVCFPVPMGIIVRGELFHQHTFVKLLLPTLSVVSTILRKITIRAVLITSPL